jgi:hypothetical protein
VVGIIGALIGGLFFSGLAGFAGGGLLGSILVATLGAVLLLVVLRVLNSKTRSRPPPKTPKVSFKLLPAISPATTA